MATNRDYISALLDQYEPRFRDAFMRAVDNLRDGADVAAVAEAIERNDLRGALAAMNLAPEAFAVLDQMITEAYVAGGNATVGQLPKMQNADGLRMVVRFDARNVRAEEWLRVHSSELITAILTDQREAIRTALEDGMRQGLNPRTVARDIVGRFDAKTQRRMGGIIGLTGQQERFAANALAELLSGDPDQLRAYLGRARRDKRFDPIVNRAIRDEKPVGREDADRMIMRYRDRLLALRGETIARTEALASLHQSQYEALQQTVDSGAVQRDQVKRIWRSASDRKVRDTHIALDGQTTTLDGQFKSPSGAQLRFPGDPLAPAAETINCRCWVEPKIDFLKGVR